MTRVILLLLLLIGLVVWWRYRQRGGGESPAPPPRAMPEGMLRCAECGMHLPISEALPGKGGSFCSTAHRQAYEARDGA